MTTYRKAELFEEILDWIYDKWRDDPVALVEALDSRGLTQEEVIEQINSWGLDGESAWIDYEEAY